MRIQQIQAVVFFLLGAVVLCLIYMQIIKGPYYRAQSLNNRIRVISLDGPRGQILDRNGSVLADNRTAYHIGVVAQEVQDRDELFNYLGRLLKKDPNNLYKLFKRKRITPFTPVILAEDVPKDIVFKVQEDRMQYPALYVEEGFERYYPNGVVGSHILGYVGKIDEQEVNDMQQFGYTPLSLVGKTGVEKSYESVLHGEPGGRQIEVNSRGQEVRLLSLKEPVKGKNIQLTIDERLQQTAQDLLRDKRGSIVVMDLSNGDVLTMVSSPTYNPNAFTDKSKNDLIPTYLKDTNFPMMNRSFGATFPPGSVFKIPVALAAIQLHKITPDVTYHCPGYYMLGRARFGCAHVHGDENMYQALAHSCNVYFFHIGQLIGPEVIRAYGKAFGLTRQTGIDLPYESKGRLASALQIKSNWYTGNTLNLSIGQGDTLTTPLQLTVLMGAVATDGVLLKPRIVKSVDGQQVPVQDITKRPIIRLRDETWRTIQKGLKLVVDDPEGTGHILQDVPGLSIYGKTGTAQSAPNKPNHAWFAGYAHAPMRNIVFCVFLEYGGSSANSVAITKDLLLKAKELNIV